jgi:hypothetical protein
MRQKASIPESQTTAFHSIRGSNVSNLQKQYLPTLNYVTTACMSRTITSKCQSRVKNISFNIYKIETCNKYTFAIHNLFILLR